MLLLPIVTVSGHRLAALLTMLSLAATPAVALADGGGGAGDQEYQDPLTAPSAPHKKKPKQVTAPTRTTTSPASATTAPASTTPAATSTAPAELPRTGAPAGLVALAGASLLAAGLVLRRRTATR